MPEAAAPATPTEATVALDRFLRGIERRALRMAELALSRRDDAFDVVQDAMRAFVRDHRTHAETDWPLPFWRALDSRLHGQHRHGVRPRWAGWLAPRRDDALDADDPRAIPDPHSPGPFLQLPDGEATACLDAALRALPQRQRQAFLLRVCEDFDVARSAQAMGVPESSVKTHLFRALCNLRARLEVHRVAAPTAPRPNAARPPDDGTWILRSRALLAASARDIDGATRSRLQRARHAALAAEAPRSSAPATGRSRAGWTWAAAAAVLAGAALLLLRLLPFDAAPASAPVATTRPAPPPAPRLAPSEDTPLAAPDFDLLADDEDAALLDELAFYAWLAAEGAPGG